MATIEQKIRMYQERAKCKNRNCGTHVVIRTTQHFIETVEANKRTYNATCTKCNASFKLRQTELEFYGEHFGEPKFIIQHDTFSGLFDED
jgi:transcription elongation factor Elf1